jgi:hypothetical protein
MASPSQQRREDSGVDFAGGMTADDYLVRATTAIEHRFLLPHLASGGCSRLAIQDHIADLRYEAMSDRYVASQFASGLLRAMLTRMVPNPVVRNK